MKIKKNYNQGMSIPELILAMFMLIAFTGFTVVFVEYTSKFFQPLKEETNELEDILNVHARINNAFDSIIEILSEPGIKKITIQDLECEFGEEIPEKWNIPSIDTNSIPKSYKICIDSTNLAEASYSDLINKKKDAKPGIYILYSKPDGGVSVNATPVRRIFCRPKPFCKE